MKRLLMLEVSPTRASQQRSGIVHALRLRRTRSGRLPRFCSSAAGVRHGSERGADGTLCRTCRSAMRLFEKPVNYDSALLCPTSCSIVFVVLSRLFLSFNSVSRACCCLPDSLKHSVRYDFLQTVMCNAPLP